MDDNTNPTTRDLLQQIVDILKTSTIIAEERGKDVRSKFWAAYKKVSGEFDDNMLERCNGNVDIILIFAGLFSAVNTAFIIAMQPNPVDTTNALLVQLIQITVYGPSAAQPTIISPSTSYPSSNFWMQALGYMSLALSLLAAFGAVLGKQWLNYYKTHRFGSGSLEQRCKQRHGKFLGLEKWCFEGLLQSLADLLKASLFLFGLSLAAWMWRQQQTISILIISTTGFGFVCYIITVLAALVDPNCPFQTRLSLAFHHFLAFQTRISLANDFPTRIPSLYIPFLTRLSLALQNLYPDLQREDLSIASAMEWMLKISTNPDAVKAALELMTSMSQTHSVVNSMSLCYKVRAMFMACFDGEGRPLVEDDALAYGKSLIQFSRNDSPMSDLLLRNTWAPQRMNFWTLWHTLYLRRALEQCQNSHRRMQKSDDAAVQSRCLADIRTALRMVVPAGTDILAGADRLSVYTFTDPDDAWIWYGKVDGKFGLELDLPDVDWLIDSATWFLDIQDFQAAGDALVLLSGVLKNSSFRSWQDTITQYVLSITHDQTRVPYTRWCRIALHAAYQALDNNHDLFYHKPFSQAVLRSICPPVDRDHDQFSDAIKLLNFTQWPKGSCLASFPLPSIQLLVLRILPAPKVDIPQSYTDYCRTLVHHMDADQPLELRRTALRIACGLRQDLATIAADGVDVSLRDMVLSELSPALLTALDSYWFNADDDRYYLRLIFALASSPDWLPRLDKDGHMKRCIRIIPKFHDRPPYSLFYLTGIFLRLQVIHPEWAGPHLSAVTSKQWWDLTMIAWHVIGNYDVLVDGIDILGALVMATNTHMPEDASRSELEYLCKRVGVTSTRLKQQANEIQSAVRGLKDLVHRRLETAV